MGKADLPIRGDYTPQLLLLHNKTRNFIEHKRDYRNTPARSNTSRALRPFLVETSRGLIEWVPLKPNLNLRRSC